MANGAVPVVELRGIGKRFPGIIANRGVDFDLYPGEIHALLGENGAGKSTLMNILFGLYPPDEGEIRIRGERVVFHSAHDAIRRGVEMVHQHFQLVKTFTVADNVMLGQPSSRAPLREDRRKVTARIRALSERFRLAVDPAAPVWRLSVGEQQRVEILKALYRGAEVLILDEPTAVLTPEESLELLGILRELAAQGTAIVFISHKLNEVLTISNRITVLRDGAVVGVTRPSETNQNELARLMVGREVVFEVVKTPHPPGAPHMVLDEVWIDDDRGLPAIQGMSLTVHAGEILGVAGVAGNGQRELEEALRGLRPLRRGQFLIGGCDASRMSTAQIIALGVGHIPSDRYQHGLLQEASIAENLALETFWRAPFTRGILLDRAAMEANATALMRAYGVRAASPRSAAGALSGGNAQKLVLARELSLQPRFLIAAQPTRGLDVSAIEYVHAELLAQRARGVVILLLSTELDEIFALADRIAVIYEGRIMGVAEGDRRHAKEIGLWMAGHC